MTELVAAFRAEGQKANTRDLSGVEAILVSQAGTLNAMFTHVAIVASRYSSSESLEHLDKFTRLALKAQSQCRATIERLALVKNPPVFARQANIANGPQQVNNGVTLTSEAVEPRASRARTPQLSAPIKLLEVPRERMD